jgi:RNA polymerase sigma-70 factor, ECF subfamily
MRGTPPSDPAARFLALLEPCQTELEAYARRLVWDPQEARDALHNALARAIAAFGRFRAESNFRAWLYQILTREAFALNRKHRRIAAREFEMEPDEIAQLADDEPAVPPPPGPDLESVQDFLDEDLVRALRMLAEEERAVLLLRAMAAFSYRDIADALDMPVGSVVGYLGRARKKMRVALGRRRRSPSTQSEP